MSDIVLKMKDEIIERSNLFEEKTKGTKDEYNIYNSHIQYVYKYAIELTKNKSVDIEVVELASLLHDIAMIDITKDRSNHNIDGAIIAEELLLKNNYPKEKIELVKNCILNHSSKRKEFRKTIEEKILVDADALAHFDGIDSIYSLAYNVMGLNEEDSIKFVKDKLTKDYNEISNDAKRIIENKYLKIMKVNAYNELINIER